MAQVSAIMTRIRRVAMKQSGIRISAIVLLTMLSGMLPAADSTLDQRAESLKREVVDLNRELFKLEEELLYPANTQVVVFLAVDTKKAFALDSVELKINGALATTYLYSEREVNALNQGGVQRLFTGNVAAGPHRVEAVFNGRGADDRYFRRQVSYDFEKKNSAKYLELVVQESNQGRLPDFIIREFK